MTTRVVHGAFGPKQVKQLKEIYERAQAVTAQYPESHVANKAAKKLIDAFETVTRSHEAVCRWLSETEPQGHA
ncbi:MULTISPECIES: hypothetical protein [unclassified Mesorhizobium]|uniref:hypothetical protein n=2 Tax=Mesorhizobium TaxID=68287 RepID=UPI000F761748|nr:MULTISPECIES: hypothetical protein [unclassified Mesorhizobium]AZO14637.1 hypothetical protein EJ069_07730 [Mesorhizobium sp. M2A.F.Ca.ET.043.05.1.1]RUX34077.1 hypothetical protein EOA23_03820 [Mesorhizobium sp. M2A.F.Ca.ET.042.01.1.1]RWD75129.1 MAG: hypothetical protein EOS37_00405 [Mesorhizobium sp.]RWE79275.1 MAG: hypothetical protein EOS42_02265 [Mesorhizobium sp.]TIR24123.1 MAG: hypothetical protein E5X34_11500 [Mesorhizobium sp.]